MDHCDFCRRVEDGSGLISREACPRTRPSLSGWVPLSGRPRGTLRMLWAGWGLGQDTSLRCPPWAGAEQGCYLRGQQPGQVDLRHHLAAPVPLLLVPVVVVLHQMPHLDPALQVWGDHGGPRPQAVGAACVSEGGV